MKLNVMGNVFSQTGFSVHTRFLAEALQDSGYDVAIESPKHPNWEMLCPDKMFKMLNKNYQREPTIMITSPDYYRLKWADNPEKLIGFCIWEGDTVPKSWTRNLELCDQIWVPSEHVKNAIMHSLSSEEVEELAIVEKMFVVPHGVDLKQFYPKKVERDDRFTFVAVKGWAEGLNDRGGLQYLIRAFVDEFQEGEAVKLMVKVNAVYGGSEELVGSWLKQAGIEKLPSNVELVFKDIPYSELIDTYNKGDVFVCSTRGEAFNLVGLEAMACGLPTLQTGFGGQLDYMTPGNSWYIDCKLEEVTHNKLLEGIKWATPDHEDLRVKLRYCFEHQDEVKQKGIQALKDVQEWSWNNSAVKAKQALDKL
ncbi:MAG: glycosyltransferase [Candidatus Paceibacterota bacterium]